MRQQGNVWVFIDGSLLSFPAPRSFNNGPGEDCADIGSSSSFLFDMKMQPIALLYLQVPEPVQLYL